MTFVAIEIEALRAAPVFADTEYATVPVPVPDAGVAVRNAALLTAVHAQPVPAVTGIVPLVAAALSDVVTEPTETVQAAADGAESLFEQAAAASATTADTAKASRRRWYLMAADFSADTRLF